jgi:hypothetical protein
MATENSLDLFLSDAIDPDSRMGDDDERVLAERDLEVSVLSVEWLTLVTINT